ncbi:hypothetical protein M440DRAFT_1199773 [Trichoderma longibrachiatum ATCC 18648]|uniref:4Fe-4S ferredoxin-type domain-containing protein n=1 Tax=Trichoderma longibrachiatum ATCC 18648 TaxID=983965 RepID=A0A2T4CAV6_TRILO|nr:hypothetical protein M440DRAFT_1199773 [Trichoderma longibrachiatum ATCC 18648]
MLGPYSCAQITWSPRELAAYRRPLSGLRPFSRRTSCLFSSTIHHQAALSASSCTDRDRRLPCCACRRTGAIADNRSSRQRRSASTGPAALLRLDWTCPQFESQRFAASVCVCVCGLVCLSAVCPRGCVQVRGPAFALRCAAEHLVHAAWFQPWRWPHLILPYLSIVSPSVSTQKHVVNGPLIQHPRQDAAPHALLSAVLRETQTRILRVVSPRIVSPASVSEPNHHLETQKARHHRRPVAPARSEGIALSVPLSLLRAPECETRACPICARSRRVTAVAISSGAATSSSRRARDASRRECAVASTSTASPCPEPLPTALRLLRPTYRDRPGPAP